MYTDNEKFTFENYELADYSNGENNVNRINSISDYFTIENQIRITMEK